MGYFFRSTFSVCVLVIGASAEAKTYSATSTTLKSVFANAVSGDTIVLSGKFAGATLQSKTFAKAVTIDARAATFTNTLKVYNVAGLTILGGHYGSTTAAVTGITVLCGDRISFTSPIVVGNRTSAHGINVSGTTNIAVSGGTFTGLKSGIALTAVTGGVLSKNKSLASTSDGFDVADSHSISITGNSCSGTAITAGAHPDCVQLWSIKGHAPQSDITISGNTATGDTQGFTSFDGDKGGGLRIKMINNRVDTTYPQGIACYQCVDSSFTGNVVTTQKGARWQTSINIVGGSNNLIANNSVGARPATVVAPAFDNVDSIASAFDATDLKSVEVVSFTDPWSRVSPGTSAKLSQGGATVLAGGEVPEPGVWALLVAGFGLVGAAFRRRRRRFVAA